MINNKIKNIMGWVLTVALGGLFLSSAFAKLSGPEEVVKGFQQMGLGDSERIGIGIVEVLCVVFFVIPRTGVLGTVLLIGYMGGTIMAHLAIHESYIVNIIIGVLIGLTGYIRFPELGSRLFGHK